MNDYPDITMRMMQGLLEKPEGVMMVMAFLTTDKRQWLKVEDNSSEYEHRLVASTLSLLDVAQTFPKALNLCVGSKLENVDEAGTWLMRLR